MRGSIDQKSEVTRGEQRKRNKKAAGSVSSPLPAASCMCLMDISKKSGSDPVFFIKCFPVFRISCDLDDQIIFLFFIQYHDQPAVTLLTGEKSRGMISSLVSVLSGSAVSCAKSSSASSSFRRRRFTR